MPQQPTPVYEWYRFEEIKQTPTQNIGFYYNPPFFPGPAGRVMPYMNYGPILRGFVKRSDIAGTVPANDPGAQGRCYFMFNPTSLSQAWNYDPSTYLWNNTSAADQATQTAGQAAFNFALFFNREIECAHNPDHAGVLVDVDMLSYITRGVPSQMAAAGRGPNGIGQSAVADPNGTFIGQGQLVDAIFSKFMTVRGNVTSLQVDYVKFTHRMIPTMCTVNIGMLVQSQSVGTQGIPSTSSPPTDTQNGGGAGNGDPSNRYGNAGGTG